MSARDLPILCLDFDGVIHSYTSGWKGANIVSDPPVPSALEFLMRAAENFSVAIHSSRSHQSGGISSMQDYLRREYENARLLTNEESAVFVLHILQWPLHKPPAFITLDDRALTFTGTFPAIETLQGFRPWYKREPERGECERELTYPLVIPESPPKE